MASVLASEGTPGSEVGYASNVELVLHAKAFCWCFGAVLVEEHPLLGPHAFAEEQLLVGLHALTKQLIVTSGCTRAAAWNLRGVTSCRAKVAARATHLTPSGDGVGGWLLVPKAELDLRRSPEVPIDFAHSVMRLAPSGDSGGRWQIAPIVVVLFRWPPKVPIDIACSISGGWGFVVRRSAWVGPTISDDIEQTRASVRVHATHVGQQSSVCREPNTLAVGVARRIRTPEIGVWHISQSAGILWVLNSVLNLFRLARSTPSCL